MASAAAKVSDDLSTKDAEILRLIEERRSTPKEGKQRLKELSKCIKNVSEKKRMKRQQYIQRILEDFKGVRNIPGIKSAKKKVLITKIKKRQKENASHLEKELPMSLVNSTKDLTRKMRKMIQNMNWMMMTITAAQTCTTTIPKRRQEFQKLRQKSCKPQSTNSKKVKSPDNKGIRAEDIKGCDEETREMVRQNLQRDYEEK